MVLMNDVPDDILLCIFQACSHCSIIKLSIVNKRFHTLSSSQLYNTINWKWEPDFTPPILVFLRTIFSRPELSKHVRHVKLTGSKFYGQYGFRRKIPPKIRTDSISASELTCILKAVEEIQSKIRMPYGEETLLLEEFRAGTMDAILPILLSQLPNLKLLHLGPNFTKEIPLLGIVLKTLLCAPEHNLNQTGVKGLSLSSFQSLQEVCFLPHTDTEWDPGWGEANIAWGKQRMDILYTAVLPFLYAPHIERLTARIEEPTSFDWLSWQDARDHTQNIAIPPPITKTLKHLDLTLLREANLGKLLAQCPNLESIKWAFYATPDRAFPVPFLDCDALGRSLEYSKETLTSVVLTVYFVESSIPIDELIPAHGSLSTVSTLLSFSRLTKLEIPFMLLLSQSPSRGKKLQGSFPRGLRELTLTDDMYSAGDFEWEEEEPLFKVIEEWLEGWREDVPALEKFVLLFRYADDRWGKAQRERFRRFEGRFGLYVEIVKLLKDLV